MARNVIPSAAMIRTGVALPAEQSGDSTNGHVLTNSGKSIIIVRNADGSNPHSVTFVTQGTVDGLDIADRTVSIPASSTRAFGGLSTSVYGRTMAVNVDSSQLKLYSLEP